MMGRGRGSAVHAAVAIASIAVSAFAGAARAQTAPAQAESRHGKQLSYTCLGCHGIDGYKNAYPMYSVPKLEGQHAEYLIAALHGYRDGDRAHLTMHSQASTLSDQDIVDIATYFAGKPLQTSGKTPDNLPQAASLCSACHGADGVAVAPMYPSLAGQHEDYLARAIEEYQKGGRKNPIMKGFATSLQDADVAAIVRYYASLTPALKTEPRPISPLTE